MTTEEIFDSCVREKGDLAGVFEYDGEAGYFYLYETKRGQGEKIVDKLHIPLRANLISRKRPVSVRWDSKEERVGLFIRNVLWAVFDGLQRLKYGGGYKTGIQPSLPESATAGFITA